MTYYKPHVDNIRWLAKVAGPFPTTDDVILDTAMAWRFSENTIEFLKLFPGNEEFKTQDDFITRCEELEMMLSEKESMPREYLRSPQE